MKKQILYSILLLLLYSCGAKKGYQVLDNGISFYCNGLKKRILFYGDSIVRISVAKDLKKNNQSLVVVGSPKGHFTVEDLNNEWILSTSFLKLIVSKETGKIEFHNANGYSYIAEKRTNSLDFKPYTTSLDTAFSIEQCFTVQEDDAFYGLGQYQEGWMNYRDREVKIVQANKVSVVPFLNSPKNYGILWDNYSHSTFKSIKNTISFSSEVADAIDYYFVGGTSMDEVVSGYRVLTGEAPLFAKSAYGYWQSKEHYTSFEELQAVVKRYRKERLPIDNIVQDWRYWGDNSHWSSMEFDSDTYPDVVKNIEKLHAMNVQLMVSIWPAIGPKCNLFRDLKAIDAIFLPKHWSSGYVYDAYNPQARSIYFDYIKRGLLSKGVDALWMDGTEPEVTHSDTQDYTENSIKSLGATYMGSAAKYLNTFSLMTTEGAYQGQREYSDQRRVFTLTRSAFAGQQRNGAVTWSGDVVSNWTVFRNQISAGLNFCMAGIPYWTHDIGGFFPSGRGGMFPQGVNDPAFRELYIRWFQFGAFSPIFRAHGTGTPREIWQFGSKDSEEYKALALSLNLRYRLLPYVYSNAWDITHNHGTLMKGLVMDFSEDLKVRNIDDEYLFGNAFLVQPICKPMYHKVNRDEGVIVAKQYLSHDGKEGLAVTYFQGKNLKKEVEKSESPNIDFNWGGGPPSKLSEIDYSIRWNGELNPTESGEYVLGLSGDDGYRLWINDEKLIDHWKIGAVSNESIKIDLEAGKSYKIKVEYFQDQGDSEIKLWWKTPIMLRQTNGDSMNNRYTTYLPKGSVWYDFWTGTQYYGGKEITESYSLSKFPLFVKGGSIVPMGSFKQYSTEDNDEEIELRVYSGADADFELYEDDNESYNYEKGVYSTIRIHWDDKYQKLIIFQREGKYRCLEERKFNIVKVSRNLGAGVSYSELYKSVIYKGDALSIDLK